MKYVLLFFFVVKHSFAVRPIDPPIFEYVNGEIIVHEGNETKTAKFRTGIVSFNGKNGEKVNIPFSEDKLCKKGDGSYEKWTYFLNKDGSYSLVSANVQFLVGDFDLPGSRLCHHILLSGNVIVESSDLNGGDSLENPLVVQGAEIDQDEDSPFLELRLVRSGNFISGRIVGNVLIQDSLLEGYVVLDACSSGVRRLNIEENCLSTYPRTTFPVISITALSKISNNVRLFGKIEVVSSTLSRNILVLDKSNVLGSEIYGGLDVTNILSLQGARDGFTFPLLLKNVEAKDGAWGKLKGHIKIDSSKLKGFVQFDSCNGDLINNTDPQCFVQSFQNPEQFNAYTIDVLESQFENNIKIFGRSIIVGSQLKGRLEVKTSDLIWLKQSSFDSSDFPDSESQIESHKTLETIASHFEGVFKIISNSSWSSRFVEVNLLKANAGEVIPYQEFNNLYDVAYSDFSGQGKYMCKTTYPCEIKGSLGNRRSFRSNEFYGNFAIHSSDSEGNYIHTNPDSGSQEGHVSISNATLGNSNQFLGTVNITESEIGDGVILRGKLANGNICSGCSAGIHINDSATILGPNTSLQGWLYVGGGTFHPGSIVNITHQTTDNRESRIHNSVMSNNATISGSILAIDFNFNGTVLWDNYWKCDLVDGCQVWARGKTLPLDWLDKGY